MTGFFRKQWWDKAYAEWRDDFDAVRAEGDGMKICGEHLRRDAHQVRRGQCENGRPKNASQTATLTHADGRQGVWRSTGDYGGGFAVWCRGDERRKIVSFVLRGNVHDGRRGNWLESFYCQHAQLRRPNERQVGQPGARRGGQNER